MPAAWHIEPLHPDFGARITGFCLAQDLSDATVDRVRRAIDDHSLLVFPNQHFSDEQQLAFTRRLGEPEPNHVILGREGRIEYFGTVGNVTDDGRQLGSGHRRTVFQTGNEMWHSDSSFREVPSAFSIVCAHEVPETGGATQFASMRAAYARLPDSLRREIAPLTVIHDYVFSRSRVGPDAVSPSHAASLPPVRQKLVRVNPRTGAANYYVGSHAREVVGFGWGESRALLDDLLARATGDEHVYTHTWQRGELVIWDNRCLLHRGTGYDADRYRRRLRQTRVQGEGPTLAEAGAAGSLG